MSHYNILWINGEPKEVHIFEMEFSDANYYRSAVSYNAFSNREAKRLIKYGCDNLPKRSHILRQEDYDFNVEHTVNYYTHFKKFYYKDIWEMYKGIGYDYKKQRYV